MSRNTLRSIMLFLCVLILLSACAHAWDGKRKGVVFGGSIGAATMPEFLKYDYSSYRIIQVGTELSFGYAPTDQLQFNYAGRSLWFPVWAIVSSPALAVTYYLKPEAPSVYFTAGGGLSMIAVGPFLATSELGANAFGGVGYEFYPGMRVALEYTHNWWEDFDVKIDDIRLCVGLLAY